jgi:C-terminal processing protease CtpA/Prc
MIEVSHDKHLSVYYQPYTFNAQPPALTFDQLTEDRKAMARDCGFRSLQVLANNVGYMKVDFFADPMACGRTAAAAMSFLANTDAVIFDLRDNSGGDPRMVALMCSYLFDKPVHLNDFYDRAANSTTEYWTPRYVPGIRLGPKPAYVLTSGHTFSGAEEFAYDLKNLKRVTVVGETTGGGAHVVSGQPAGKHFIVYVPHGRSISPVTRTDWEGTGVTPDVVVSAEDALQTAERMAAQKIQFEAGREITNAKVN